MRADDLIRAQLWESALPQGECFSWAYHRVHEHQKRGEKAVMKHGIVHHPWTGKPYPHAWVEHNGKVYDWQTTHVGLGKPHSVESFKEGYKPKNVRSYTADQARVKLVRRKHFGPW